MTAKMKHNRGSSDFGLYRELRENRKKCLVVICGSVVAAVTVFVTITYLAILLTESDHIQINTIRANAQSNNPKQSGRPFEVKVIGLPPQQFTPTAPTIPPTTKKTTTLSYPQINYFKQHSYPKSIQDVIDYVTDKTVHQNITNIREEFRSSTPNPSKEDSFYPFKPSNPSDVNLLATGGVRFAPPVWRTFKKFSQKPIPIHTFINMSNYDVPTRIPRLVKSPNPYNPHTENTDILATVKKPLMVSINIVPMENNVIRRYPYQQQQQQQQQLTKKDVMTLNLKVFPDMTYFENQDNKQN